MGRPQLASLALTAICCSVPVTAQEDAEPEIDFLEYLGSWEAEDEEWFVEAEIDGKNKMGVEPREDRDSDERD